MALLAAHYRCFSADLNSGYQDGAPQAIHPDNKERTARSAVRSLLFYLFQGIPVDFLERPGKMPYFRANGNDLEGKGIVFLMPQNHLDYFVSRRKLFQV